MSDDVRWSRSYVLEEDSGSLGTVCIYQATSPEAIRQHASLADLRSRHRSRGGHRCRSPGPEAAVA
jgi:hypothetical protein